MAQNEMKAKPAPPERVRSMEGLGRILGRHDLDGKEEALEPNEHGNAYGDDDYADSQ